MYDATRGRTEDLGFYLALATRPAMRVLDLDCGTGSLCDAFAARAPPRSIDERARAHG